MGAWCFIGEAIQRSPEELREPALELVDTPIREYDSRQSQSDGSPFMDVSAMATTVHLRP